MAARLPRLSSLLLAGACAGTRLAAQTDTAHVESVTGETLHRAGATRLNDVLRLGTSWPVSTVDGFTWQVAPPGGSPFTPARTLVLVDGRRVEADLLGRLDIDRLGVPLERIGRVDFIELPNFAAGRIMTEGTLHIHTTEP
ncbi:MAG TPA: Plug domain-containing protein, partial [Gemmatimonadales bacterium]|nr:Plug domain-containing protein [Gemmatimonadales bacterium]